MKTVLLTGGCGYIGSHTFVELITSGYQVIILDDFSNSDPNVIECLMKITGSTPKVYRGSVLDVPFLRQIAAENQIDAIVHFAALKSIPDSFERPNDYFNCNVTGLLNVLSVFGNHGVNKIVFSSSATVYGHVDNNAAQETLPRSYTNPYGFTKLVGEQILEQLSENTDWSVGILRYFNPVGAHESNLIGESPSQEGANLFPYVVSVTAGEKPHLNVYGSNFPTSDGTGVRDYIHVSDLAQGHIASLAHLLEEGSSHTVNLGTGTGHSVLDVVSEFERITGTSIAVKLCPRRQGDVASSVADPSVARTLLGFTPKLSLSDMVQTAWNWKRASFK